jgi:hypothetical protein
MKTFLNGLIYIQNQIKLFWFHKFTKIKKVNYYSKEKEKSNQDDWDLGC